MPIRERELGEGGREKEKDGREERNTTSFDDKER